MKLITFPHAGTRLHFIFGPYRERVPGTYGVRLTEDHQLDAPCDLHFPIRDYGVPDARSFEMLLINLIKIAEEGHVVYVGCYGGIGRTGMIVAGLARVLIAGVNPVSWAREYYLGHAVETERQEVLISTFDVNRVREATFRADVATRTPASDGVPAVKNPLHLDALWAKVVAVFGNARRQAGDDPRNS